MHGFGSANADHRLNRESLPDLHLAGGSVVGVVLQTNDRLECMNDDASSRRTHGDIWRAVEELVHTVAHKAARRESQPRFECSGGALLTPGWC